MTFVLHRELFALNETLSHRFSAHSNWLWPLVRITCWFLPSDEIIVWLNKTAQISHLDNVFNSITMFHALSFLSLSPAVSIPLSQFTIVRFSAIFSSRSFHFHWTACGFCYLALAPMRPPLMVICVPKRNINNKQHQQKTTNTDVERNARETKWIKNCELKYISGFSLLDPFRCEFVCSFFLLRLKRLKCSVSYRVENSNSLSRRNFQFHALPCHPSSHFLARHGEWVNRDAHSGEKMKSKNSQRHHSCHIGK